MFGFEHLRSREESSERVPRPENLPPRELVEKWKQMIEVAPLKDRFALDHRENLFDILEKADTSTPKTRYAYSESVAFPLGAYLTDVSPDDEDRETLGELVAMLNKEITAWEAERAAA